VETGRSDRRILSSEVFTAFCILRRSFLPHAGLALEGFAQRQREAGVHHGLVGQFRRLSRQ